MSIVPVKLLLSFLNLVSPVVSLDPMVIFNGIETFPVPVVVGGLSRAWNVVPVVDESVIGPSVEARFVNCETLMPEATIGPNDVESA
jgi:hypothetical protein